MTDTNAGRAAVSFIDALKGQPLSLALVVMNFSLIGFVYIQSTQFTEQRADNVKIFTEIQREAQKLLSECIVPPRGSRGQVLFESNPSTSGASAP